MRHAFKLLSLLFATGSCMAYDFPKWDVYRMCADASAIVVGDQLDGDKVALTRWIKGAADTAPATIVITDLSRHSKPLTPYIWVTE